MKNKIALMLLIDIIIIAIYSGGFYIIKYRIPKQLETSIIDIEKNTESQKDTWEISKENFSKTIEQTNSTYKSENISIEITQYDKTINGDYYGYSDDGLVIRNGKLYRGTVSDEDICILYYNGTMKTFSAEEIDIEQKIENGAYQAWNFGPSLLENGKKITNFQGINGHLKKSNPRTAIGYYEPGHYCFVTVDGRSEESSGVTLVELSKIFEELGCVEAYNLDGGKSSVMTFNDQVINEPTDGGRKVSDCIYIQEASK